jgi:hypothetical protein
MKGDFYMRKEAKAVVEQMEELTKYVVSEMADDIDAFDEEDIKLMTMMLKILSNCKNLLLEEARILDNIESQNDEILKLLASGR